MNLILTWIASRLAQAKTPEDVFSELKGSPLEQTAALRNIYHQMARAAHPDVYMLPEEKSYAGATFNRLTEWFNQAEAKIKLGTYGQKTSHADTAARLLQTQKHVYSVSGRFSEGPLYNSYPCEFEENGKTSDAVLKIVRDPQDNVLAQNEAAVLQKLGKAENAAKFLPYLPGLIDSFIYAEAGMERFANVFNPQPGCWYSLAAVRSHYPGGIDPKDMAWMWRRLLVALGFAHTHDIIHAAVLPENVFIQPEEHGLMLNNWAYAAGQDDVLASLNPHYQDWYPLEIKNQEGLLPGSDIDLAAKCMVYLLGGDAVTRSFPALVPKAMQSFLKGCTLPGKRSRPQDAWALKEEFDDLLHRVYGERKFHPFVIPRPSFPPKGPLRGPKGHRKAQE
jgi:hypothetical protein